MAENYEKQVKRVANSLWFCDEAEAVERLEAEGVPSDQIFLIVKGAQILYGDEDEG